MRQNLIYNVANSAAKNTKIMLNHQTKTQNIAYFATFFAYKSSIFILWTQKRDLPKRTDPFHYISVIITLLRLPARQQ